ncbi:uncharacterized protein PGTG_20114, partial [Puccinia graminis f. sp. tritici CRL 75-36-700-3]
MSLWRYWMEMEGRPHGRAPLFPPVSPGAPRDWRCDPTCRPSLRSLTTTNTTTTTLSSSAACLTSHHLHHHHLKRRRNLIYFNRATHNPSQSPVNLASHSPPEQALQWKPIHSKLSLSRRIALYQALSKARLSSLITLTTMASYALSPITAATPPSSLTTLLATATGTFLCSASANTLNQIFEAPMDAQMSEDSDETIGPSGDLNATMPVS